MQEIAILELIQYEKETTVYKPSHSGIRTPMESFTEIDKNYHLKFSHNIEGKYRFCDRVEEKGGKYSWWEEPRDIDDERYFPRLGDNCELPDGYNCWCSAMTHFLLEKGFKIHNIGNIIHTFTK